MGTSTVSMGKSLFLLYWSLFQSLSNNCTWLIHVRWKKQINPWRRWPATARQNGRGVWLYNSPPGTAFQISSKEATERAVHSTARNSTRSHISGEYSLLIFPYSLSIFHSYCKYGNQFNNAVLWRGTTRNQDSRGIRPRGVNRVHQAQGEPWGSLVAWVPSWKWYLASIQLWTDHKHQACVHQAQGEPWGSPVAWVSSRKWYLASIQLWTDQAKRGLNNVDQVNPRGLLFKQKRLWPARRGHLGCKTLQMWTAKTSQPPHKCLIWTPRWTITKTMRCLWWNGL